MVCRWPITIGQVAGAALKTPRFRGCRRWRAEIYLSASNEALGHSAIDARAIIAAKATAQTTAPILNGYRFSAPGLQMGAFQPTRLDFYSAFS